MRFCVLGDLTVEADRPRPIGGPQLRRTLAALLIDAGRTVSSDRLAEIVFDGAPTASAATTIRSYIARLRRVLVDDGSNAEIVTASPGYRLELGTSTLDADEFAAAAEEARRCIASGDPGAAIAVVDDALTLWRGRPYAEFADEAWARAEAARLDEMVVEARELRLRALVDSGGHNAAIGDLTQLIEERPLRTAPWVVTMDALYQAGRQAEALRVAARHRRTMTEHGLDPDPDLVALEQRIAVHDPALRRRPRAGELRGYELLDELADGRHGALHLAQQPGFDREVVLKIFGADLADDHDVIRGLDALVQRVAGLEHPHVVPILDYWREPGRACLVSRFFSGGTLRGMLAKGPAGADAVAAMVEQIAGALAAAHRAGLVHGALTPEDILFDEDANAFVDGIGIVRRLDTVLGTGPPPPYEPVDDPDDPAADQLGLAVLAYEALTGFFPHRRDGSRAAFPLVSAERPELLAVDGVLVRAGAVAPEDRYPDIAGFADAFGAALGRGPRTRPTGSDVANPYRGLRAFGEADAELFFGRERVIADLVTVMDRDRPPRFVTVVGASGSGKSSVVRAGLLSALRVGTVPGSDTWFVATMIPGTDPFAALGEALVPISTDPRQMDPAVNGVAESMRRALPDRGTLVLVVDQLEELFTHSTDEAARDSFIEQLTDVVSGGELDVRVVATLRADLFDRPLGHHGLGGLVAACAVPIVGMSPTELERAVVEPAVSVGIGVDGAVVAEIVTACANRPGALPLLQFTMTELFERRTGSSITIADYEQMGGITGAIAERAERVYASLTVEQQQRTRTLFLRLVSVESGGSHLRRRIERAALAGEDGQDSTSEILERFGRARLLTFDREPATRAPTVEVAHEALLSTWPRLERWVRDEGRDLETRGELAASAVGWDRRGRDPAELARGTRLAVIDDYAERNTDALNPVERSYVADSVAARDEELEVERARAARQRRLSRRLGVALLVGAALLVVAVVLAGFAAVQRDRARDEASAGERSRGRALAVSAIEELADDRSLSLLLALEAGRLDDSVVTQRALLAALAGGEAFSRTVIPTPAEDYSAIVVDEDGTFAVAKRGDGALDIVDLSDRDVRRTGLPSPSRIDGGLTLHPDGSFVASAGVATDGTAVVVIDVATGERVAMIDGEPGELYEARFAPDGSQLAVGGPDGRIRLFDTATWNEEGRLDLGESRSVLTLEYLDRSTLIASATPLVGRQPQANATFTVFDVESREVTVGPVDAGVEFVTTLEIVSDLGVIVAAANEQLQAYNVGDLSPLDGPFGQSLFGYTGITFSPQGLLVAVGPLNFDVFAIGDDGPEQLSTPGSATYGGASFASDGEVLVAADVEGSIATILPGWVDDLGHLLEPAGPGAVTISPDGDTLAVWARMRGVQFFDAATLEHRGALPIGPDRSFVGFGFDPAGERVVTLTCDITDHGPEDPCPATLEIWDVTTREALAAPADVGDVWANMFAGVTFTSGGDLVATAQHRGGVQLWDAATLTPTGPPFSLQDVAPFPGDQTRIVASTEVDGRTFLVANAELSEAVVWELVDGVPEPVGVITGVADVGVTSDGHVMAAQGHTTFELVDPRTLEPIGARFVGGDASPTNVADDGGETLFMSGFQGAQLWDVETRQPSSGVFAAFHAALSGDGSRLFLGGLGIPGEPGGSQVRALQLDTDELRADACARAGRNLTVVEWELYMPADRPYTLTCPQWPKPDA